MGRPNAKMTTPGKNFIERMKVECGEGFLSHGLIG
jgi:hypothetical protein